ncbi:hypothetical protein LCGC14_2656010 [marine sediment metagenome]|uniref:Uncharacterized protein n=1 Tax=marine sediment metagenome TaxID=412755 RepID=A0A0F9AFP9_9ZZZZ
MPKKKETQKEAIGSFAEAIRKLREKVRKELDKNKKAAAKSKSKSKSKSKFKPKPKPKPKKKVPDTKRTKDVQRGLKQAGAKFKTDREKAEEKRKKKNTHHKKSGGY